MKLSSIQEPRPTLALAEAAAKVFTKIIYTIDEDYDFFGHMMNKIGGGRGRGYIDHRGRYRNKPQLKDKDSFTSQEAWLRHKQEYEKEMEQYYRNKDASKASGGRGRSGGASGTSLPPNPYAQAAAGVVGAGAAALKSKIAPSVSSSSNALLGLFTSNKLNAAGVKQLINAVANHKSDILNDETWLQSFFDKFGSLDANSRNNILAITKSGALKTESALSIACLIIDQHDCSLVEDALRMTRLKLATNGQYISEAGIRRIFDAARRFVAQPQAVAASVRQSQFKNANVSNAKLLVQNIIKHYEQRLNEAGVKPNQLASIMNDPAKLQNLKLKLRLP